MNALRRRLLLLPLSLLLPPSLQAAESGARRKSEPPPISSKALEQELQSLNWEQFRFVINSVPKLRAEVDAYGPLGWQYVQRNYRSYAWSKPIGKLDQQHRRELQSLIAQARNRPPAH